MDLLSQGHVILAWYTVIGCLSKLTQQEIIPNETLLLFWLFTGENEDLSEKELVAISMDVGKFWGPSPKSESNESSPSHGVGGTKLGPSQVTTKLLRDWQNFKILHE